MKDASVIPDNARIAVNPGHLAAELEDTLVILSAKTENYYGLDVVGVCVWKFLDQPRAFDEIIGCVRNTFDVDIDTAVHDLTNLLQEMQHEGILTISVCPNENLPR